MSNRSSRSSRSKAIVDFESSQQPSTSSARGHKNNPRKNACSTVPEEIENDCTIDTNSTEFEFMISNCIRFILFNEYSKTLIKQSDLYKLIMENNTIQRKDIVEVIKIVKKQLFDDFGFHLIEVTDCVVKSYFLHTIYPNNLLNLDDEDDMENGDGDDSTDNLFEDFYDDHNYFEEQTNSGDINLTNVSYDQVLDTSKSTLLLISLSLILLEETQVLAEKDLFQNLKDIGFDLDAKIETAHDSQKLSIKELISKEFVRQKYLKRNALPHQDTSSRKEYNYLWATRAHIEFKKSDIVNFVKDIFQSDHTYLNQLEKKVEELDRDRIAMINGSAPIVVIEENNDDEIREIEPSTSSNRSRRMVSSQQVPPTQVDEITPRKKQRLTQQSNRLNNNDVEIILSNSNSQIQTNNSIRSKRNTGDQSKANQPSTSKSTPNDSNNSIRKSNRIKIKKQNN